MAMGEQYLGNMQFTERVKEEANIVELIGQYVKLKKSGKSYVGLCPFHDEKTPSFHVTENPKLYYCFGCGEGGDVIGFFMKKEGMIFPEARDYVARESGIPVPVFRMIKSSAR